MAILKQNADSNTTFLGWYGKCGEPKCHDFNLMEAKDKIASVYQFTESGLGTKTFVSSVPDFMQGLTKLVCGTSYWVVLHKGDGEIDIPEFTIGHFSESGNLGSITDVCYPKKPDPTPTPTPTSDDKICTQDVRECPDGSSVGRDGQCKFPPCGWSADQFRQMATHWKHNQPIHHKFNFKYIGKGEVASSGVCIEVRFGRIVKIKKLESSEYVSLDFNDSISDADEKNKTKMRFRTIDQLFAWIHLAVKSYPYSVEVDYDQEWTFPKKILIDMKEDETDDLFGFEIWNFEELEYKGKCPPDKRKCSDGTYVKRDPENNCKFHDCSEPATPTPVPETPKLKFRWLWPPKIGGGYPDRQLMQPPPIIQVQGAINPWNEDEVEHLPWRTLYGSIKDSPENIDMDHWKHLRVDDDYVKNHGSEHKWNDVLFGVDEETDNQLTASVAKSQVKFYPSREDFKLFASHLYLYKNDTQTSVHKSWEFPHMKKSSSRLVSFELGISECEDDIQMCADGSYVERNPDNECEFYPCPEDGVDVDYDLVEDNNNDGPVAPPLADDDTPLVWHEDGVVDSDDSDNPDGDISFDMVDTDPDESPDLDDDGFVMDDSFGGDDELPSDTDTDILVDAVEDEESPDLDDDGFVMDDSFGGDAELPVDEDPVDEDPVDEDPVDEDPDEYALSDLDTSFEMDPDPDGYIDTEVPGDNLSDDAIDTTDAEPIAEDFGDLIDMVDGGTLGDTLDVTDSIPSYDPGNPFPDEDFSLDPGEGDLDDSSALDAPDEDLTLVDYDDSVDPVGDYIPDDMDFGSPTDNPDSDTLDFIDHEDTTDSDAELGDLIDPIADGEGTLGEDLSLEPISSDSPNAPDEIFGLDEVSPDLDESGFQSVDLQGDSTSHGDLLDVSGLGDYSQSPSSFGELEILGEQDINLD